jgi:hypothetical protein
VFDNPFGELNNLAILSRYVLPASDPALPEEPVVELTSEALAAYVGEYQAPQGDFRIEVADGGLRLSGEGSPPMVIEPLGSTRFRGTIEGLVDVYFEFDLDATGVAQGGRATFGFRDDLFRRIGS